MIQAADIWARFSPGDRVYVAGATGAPRAALAALEAEPERGRGLAFTGVWLPGVNEIDPTAQAPGATADVFFATPALAEGIAAGRVRHRPLHYTDIHRWLAGPAGLAGAVVAVSPPVDGQVSPGISGDFFASVLASGCPLIGEVTPELPVPPRAPRLPVERFAALAEGGGPRPVLETGRIPEAIARIGAQVAGMVPDGATVQLGLGKAAAAVLRALAGRRGLAYHAGMISEGVLDRLDDGTFSAGVTCNVALGTAAFYDRVARDDRIRFAPVAETHAQATLAAIPRLVAVNSAISVDLFGQANSEMLDGRQISGHGGVADFQRGARAAPEGRAILVLPAAAGGGRVSRIVPTLGPEAPAASIPRADADVVVTEHGVADLRWLDAGARAEALIAVAAPEHRDRLARDWAARRDRLAGRV
jgi:acyl-CoA hydrolase